MNSPQSVTRVIQILEALCASEKPLSLAHLSRTLDAPKSSVAALVHGLLAAHFVVPTDGAFRLGPSAFGLGSALLEARRHLQSSDLIREGMRRLAVRSHETVLYAVRDTGAPTMTYVDVIESRNSVRFAVTVGDRRPLYCTAGGRVLLAAVGEDALKRYLRGLRPQRLTNRTEVNKQRLAEFIAITRRTGSSQTVDQATEGVTGTASAIHDASGALVGALIVAAPSARLKDQGAALSRLVLEEAAAISSSLGFRMMANS